MMLARHVPTFIDLGPAVCHDMACPVYWYRESAVFDMGTEIFQPSWAAQRDGFITLRIRWGWLRRWMQKIFR